MLNLDIHKVTSVEVQKIFTFTMGDGTIFHNREIVITQKDGKEIIIKLFTDDDGIDQLVPTVSHQTEIVK
tara:strand:+ start:107 stop:316 length:210 start_codon:yes stop_codon:yes gene_type:complete